ncbi:MAG: DUF5131 family protein [Chloroflexota bacterium]
MSDEGKWWGSVSAPYSGCPNLSLPPSERSAGCRSCWTPSFFKRFPAIHNGPPSVLELHPDRLRKCLTTRKPQRFGWILGEPAEVARKHPEYLAACVGVALARPDHGFGVPTSDPAAVVAWARAVFPAVPRPGAICMREAEPVLNKDMPRIYEPWPPPNWIWLLSISTQQEADERLPYGVELGRMGWRWGVHAEPMLEPLAIIPDAYGASLADMPAWIASGPPKGHRPTEAELDWHRALMQQCWYAGAPYWFKGETLPGEALHNRELPAGWPGAKEQK